MRKLILFLVMYFSLTAVYAQHKIGEKYGGGIVFYVNDNGKHGLIAATADQSTGIQWFNGTYDIKTKAVRNGIGAGSYNTSQIIASQGEGEYAATICTHYRGGNYEDWYLPCKDELNLLYLQKDVVGGFDNGIYWSSSEGEFNGPWVQFFDIGAKTYSGKNFPNYVRAIRAF